jgi:hypothetical protein
MNGKNGVADFEFSEFTKEGLQFGEQYQDRSHRKGITRLITSPMTDGFFHGVSAAFRTGASSGKSARDFEQTNLLNVVR